MLITVYEAFSLNKAIEHLLQQEVKISFSNGYELLKLQRELNDIEQYAVKRLNCVINNEHLNKNELTDEENVIYLAVMNSEVQIKEYNINIEELQKSKEITASLVDIKIICDIFGEKNDDRPNEN